MDFLKVQEALGVCEELIKAALGSTTALEHIPTGKFHHDAVKLYHCLDMIKQMRDWGPERLEKSFRWLGYIQGMMHAFDVCDLEVLKEMSRPNEADTVRENEAKTRAQKLADQLELSIQWINHPNAHNDENFFRECVAALRGELPEPPEEKRKDPLPKLKAELQRRLDDENLINVSTEELNELGEFAASVDGIENDRLRMQAGLAEMRDMAAALLPKVMPGIIRWANGAVDLRANVLAFHREISGDETLEKPCVPEENIARRRLRLIAEEFFEVMNAAFDERPDGEELVEPFPDTLDRAEEIVMEVVRKATLDVDLAEFAKELADLEYVCEGAFLGFGIDSRPVHTETHKSNMSKKNAPRRADGKIGKPEGWLPPDIKSIIEAQVKS